MNKNIVLIGGGDFAKKTIKLISIIGNYNIIGYTDKTDFGKLFNRVEYIGNDQQLEIIINEYPKCCAVVCIAGNLELIKYKQDLVSKLKEIGYNFPKLISPNAYIDESAILDEGCIVFDNSYIDLEVSVGAFSIVNLCVLLCHNTIIGKFVTISPKVTTGGGVRIGNNSFIGMNVTIRPYTEVANNIIVGFGAVVTKNCLESGIYLGNPAKIK